MLEVKHRLLSGALDENIDTQAAAVALLGALQGLWLVFALACFSEITSWESGGQLPFTTNGITRRVLIDSYYKTFFEVNVLVNDPLLSQSFINFVTAMSAKSP